MSIVAVLFHSERTSAVQKLLDWLTAEGHEVCLPTDDAHSLGNDVANEDVANEAVTNEGLAGKELADSTGFTALAKDQLASAHIDLAVSVGGDGTMLRAFDLLAPHEVPVIGINVGHLGYLTEFELHDMTASVQLALENKLPVEQRMMIEASLAPATSNPAAGEQADQDKSRDLGPWIGLNEVILEKRDLGHTIRTEVTFDEQEFTTYAADGLIISTPTGSTAYSLSAGGAVVAPTHRCLQLTPVAPHMLFDRSIILGPEAEIRCRMLGVRSANLAVDGRSVARLSENDTLIVRRANTQALLVTSDQTSFQAILKQKLGLINR